MGTLDKSCSEISAVLNIGTDIETSLAVVAQSDKSQFPLYCAVGIAIPHIAEESLPQDWVTILQELIKSESVIAIGETGIDSANSSYPPMDLQLTFFQKHIALALENDLPLIVHSRGSEREALEICKEMGVKKVVFHCYTGPAELVSDIMEAGYYISLSGIVTFKKSGLEEVVQLIESNKLLIETDSPYLAPVPFRGKQNRPNYVSLVGDTIAELRGISPEELKKNIQTNFETLFSVSVN